MKMIPILFLILLNGSLVHAEKLKVLIYNTWGVPFTVWDTWRYEAAMQAIEKINPDIVVLSEVFTVKAKQQFKSNLYPYHADGGNWIPRLIGSGTRILSKFPIQEHAILTYHACSNEDCLSRKGANLITVLFPSGKKLNIVGTHLNSAGGEETRISQLDQLAIFSDWYEDKTAPTIIAGDLNFNPLSNEYNHAKKKLKVSDSWGETHLDQEPGFTYSCFNNHYAHDYTLKTHGSFFEDRIDYLFYRGNISVVSTNLEMNIEDTLFSDHYGVLGEFEI